MENQDKIFEQFQKAAEKPAKNFPAMDKVWSRVEEKLDKKEDKKVIALWKKLAVAASLLLFFSLGYQFLKTDIKPNVIRETGVVTVEPKDSAIVKPTENAVVKSEDSNSSLKKDSDKILQKQIEKQSDVAIVDTVSEGFMKNDPIGTNQFNRNNASNVASSNADFYVAPKAKKMAPVLSASDMIAHKEVVMKDDSAKIIKAEAIITTDAFTGLQTISGVVTDNSTLPLPGVTVVVKETSRRTTTDFDGKFSIEAEKGQFLEFSFIGMKNAYAVVDKKTPINISLEDDAVSLEGVVVEAYGISPKKQNKMAQANITRGDRSGYLLDRSYINGSKKTWSESESKASKSVQSKVAGLEITPANPGSNVSVVLRGTASNNQNKEPLYIVDGIPTNAAMFSTLKPETIKSISVIKDNSATAIYGSRGANGVIVVNTKEGKFQDLSKKEIKKRLRELEKTKKENKQAFIPDENFTNEDYDSFVENSFESPKSAPLSTFSIDVDNASYTNVRRFINNGQKVPKDAVRVEEMINFFKYNYPQPTNENPFSINTEYSDCPWNAKHKLLKIGLQGKVLPTDNLPNSNLVFLIDVSGSMNDQNKLPLLKQSMKILVNELRKKDKVAIVVYAGAAGVVLPPTSGDEKQTIIDALENLNAGGSTAGGAGIELAYKLAEENFINGGNNRVILATDGDFNVGSSSNTDMQTLIEQKRQSGVFLTCLGYGMGNYKDSKMEILSDKGNGNYAYIDNIQEANRFLGKEFKGSMFAIAKDVKIQIEFNPKHVQSYRLIGYENRKLRSEDFTNDTIDAGELGSGHTVTALYEIIPTGIKSDYFNETADLKYTKTEQTTGNFNDELATVKFRYKKPDGDKSIEMVKVIENKSVPVQNASDNFKFSAAVAWFGLKLRDSKLIENKSSEAIKKLAKDGLSNDNEGYKAEFIRLVETIK